MRFSSSTILKVSLRGPSIEEKLKALLWVLQHNCALREMPLEAIHYSSVRKVLRVDVPAITLDDSEDQQIRDRVMELIRYAILAEAVYGLLADMYIIRETNEDGKEQVIATISQDLLHEYNLQTAGLLDLLHNAMIRVNGVNLRLSVDFEEVSKLEQMTLGETFPRRKRSPS